MVLVIILYLLFASTFTLGKAALAYVSPFLFIGMRMMLGGSLLLGYYKFGKKQKIAIIASVTSSAYGWMVVKTLINRKYPLILINGISMTGGGILALILSCITEGLPYIKEVAVTTPGLVTLFGLTGEQLIMLGGYC